MFGAKQQIQNHFNLNRSVFGETILKIFFIIFGISLFFLILISVVLWFEYGMVCNNAVTTHLQKYSNLFYENTTRETFGIENIGYPFGVHALNIQECVDYVFDNRELGAD